MTIEDTKEEKDKIIALKENEIQQMKLKMDQMAHEFGDMLKETLDKMSERIEITNSSWDSDSGVPITRKMEEFKIE